MPNSIFENLNQSVRVFCFLDLKHPAVAWAVMRGILVSADHVSNDASPGFVSFMQAGIFSTPDNRRLFNEALIETVRLNFFPNSVSRMRGMFFFRTRQEAEARIGDYKWPKYFQLENLLELELHFSDAFTDVDANWITFAPRTPEGRLTTSNLEWIKSYWRRESYNSKPVWERIAKGVAIVLDTQVRWQCYQAVHKFFPDAKIPILMSRLAAETGTRGGMTSPFLLRQDGVNVELGYLWSEAEFHDQEAIKKIQEHPDSGILGRMMVENETWKLPDFRPWGRVFELREQEIPGLIGYSLPYVHTEN